MDFYQFIEIIKNEFGLYRIIALFFEFTIPKITQSFPYKSYIVIVFFYLSYYILCEKILSLININENIRVFTYLSTTTTFLILPTIFTWTRTQNEFISVLISWFFVKKIVDTKKNSTHFFLIIVWGILSLLSYELHFPFLIILLLCLGYVSLNTVIFGALTLPIVLSIIPASKHKMNLEFSHIYNALEKLWTYFQLKIHHLLSSFDGFTYYETIIPFLIIIPIFVIYFLLLNNHEIKNTITFSSKFNIFILSFLVVLFLYSIAWPNSYETIAKNGKLNWNTINVFWMNIVIILISGSKNKTLHWLMHMPIFFMILLSSILIRLMNNQLQNKNLTSLDSGIFKNFYIYIM